MLLLAAPAAAAERYVTVKGVPAPGPARYDKTWVQKIGPNHPKRVLALATGTQGGAGGVSPVARDIVRRVPGLAVWVVDRRVQAFEDTSVFERRDPAEAQDYYLGRFAYKRVAGTDAKYVADWGLKVHLGDLRRVVTKARAGGRRDVYLGGHSAGASTAVAYAAWDFAGRPGFRDLSGLVLIDGGLRGSFDSANLDQARSQLAEMRSGDVFLDLLGLGLPSIAGVFAQAGALWACERPDEPSALQSLPLIPDTFKPAVRATNEALFGYAFDAGTSPPFLGLIHVNAGRLADSGDPRGWQDGERTPIRRHACAYAANKPNAVEWYYPRRLGLDLNAASALRPTPASRYLGLRIRHGRRIDAPLYAYGTSLVDGRVTRGARLLARSSPIKRPTLVDDRGASHLDPLSGKPGANRFLKTVVPFLKRLSP